MKNKEKYKELLENYALAPEDWEKIPTDTKVIVSDDGIN